MTQQDRNIYKNCRAKTGLTQETWAEKIGVSVETVRRYELGLTTPDTYTVRKMIDVSDYEALALQYVRSSQQDLQVLPDAQTDLPLSIATIRVINRVAAFFSNHRDRQLLQIAEDGVIDDEERPLFNAIMQELQELAASYYGIKYAAKEAG